MSRLVSNHSRIECDGSLSTLRELRATSDAAIVEWRAGGKTDAVKLLCECPELLNDRSIVLDLALEEYCLRRSAGESVNPSIFRNRFSSFGIDLASSIERLVAVEDLFTEHELSAPAFEWPTPGADIGRFQIVEELGRGALARAYLCLEPAVGNREVVVKLTACPTGEESRLGQLADPRISLVHSVSACPRSGGHLICMPYQGRLTLHGLIERTSRLDYECCGTAVTHALIETGVARETLDSATWASHDWRGVAIELLCGIAAALDHAHGRKVVHGDIKPSNVLVTAAGPVLIDFNLSRRIGIDELVLGGTLPYLAPEVWETIQSGSPEDAPEPGYAADTYAFALTAAELVHGSPPAIGNDREALRSLTPDTVYDLQRQCIALAAERLGPKDQLGALLLECTAKSVTERPAIREVRARLERLADAEPTQPRPAVRRRTIIAGGITACLLAMVAPFGANRSNRLEEGCRLLREGKPAEAIAVLSEELRSQPHSVAARYSLVWAMMQAGGPDEVWPELERLREQRVDDPVRVLHGYCCAANERFADAVAWYESVEGPIEATPAYLNNFAICYWRGRSQNQEHTRADRAVDLILAALEIREDDPALLENLLLIESDRLAAGVPIDVVRAELCCGRLLASSDSQRSREIVGCFKAVADNDYRVVRLQLDSLAPGLIEHSFVYLQADRT